MPHGRSIQSGLSYIKDAMIWTIGNGLNINIGKDNWLPDHHQANLSSYYNPHANHNYPVLVSVFLLNNTNWNTPLLSSMFPPHIVIKILKIIHTGGPDVQT
ncbi:hypothetical protein LIER_42351 [Lithospermum erythrorhizon]|uniref:Uncharacterized protein n=1 Tax=Lithospermum erythrorhizon TaxID=34254 RepID=A0AAV3RNB9_LITER